METRNTTLKSWIPWLVAALMLLLFISVAQAQEVQKINPETIKKLLKERRAADKEAMVVLGGLDAETAAVIDAINGINSSWISSGCVDGVKRKDDPVLAQKCGKLLEEVLAKTVRFFELRAKRGAALADAYGKRSKRNRRLALEAYRQDPRATGDWALKLQPGKLLGTGLRASFLTGKGKLAILVNTKLKGLEQTIKREGTALAKARALHARITGAAKGGSLALHFALDRFRDAQLAKIYGGLSGAYSQLAKHLDANGLGGDIEGFDPEPSPTPQPQPLLDRAKEERQWAVPPANARPKNLTPDFFKPTS